MIVTLKTQGLLTQGDPSLAVSMDRSRSAGLGIDSRNGQGGIKSVYIAQSNWFMVEQGVTVRNFTKRYKKCIQAKHTACLSILVYPYRGFGNLVTQRDEERGMP